MAIATSEKETKVSDKPDNQEKPKEQEKAPTAEELKAMADENVAEFFDNDRLTRTPTEDEDGNKIEKKVEKKPEPAAAKPEEKPAKVEKKEDEKPKLALEGDPVEEKEKEKPAAPPARGLSDDEIDEVADRLASRTQQRPEKKEQQEQPKDPFVGFDGAERDQLQAVDFLAKRDPKFKGRDLVKETTGFWTAEQAYIQEWEKKHDGETFNPDDAEHAAFYRKNSPAGLTDDVLENARIDMRADTRVTEERSRLEHKFQKEIEERFAPIEREKAMAQAAPEVAKSINSAVAGMVAEVLPDFVGEEGLTKEVIEKIQSEDPVAMELLSEESALLNVRIRELEHLRHLQNKFEFNPDMPVTVAGQTIKPHSDIIDTAIELEQKIQKLPADQQVHEGKTFVTREGRNKLVNDVVKSDLPKADKERRIERIYTRTWAIEIDDIRDAMITKSASRVKKTLDIANKRAEHSAKKNGKAQEKPAEQKVEEKTEKKGSSTPKPISGESDIVHSKVPGAGTGPSQSEMNTQAWFS